MFRVVHVGYVAQRQIDLHTDVQLRRHARFLRTNEPRPWLIIDANRVRPATTPGRCGGAVIYICVIIDQVPGL